MAKNKPQVIPKQNPKQNKANGVKGVAVSQSYSGPVPDPNSLRQYEEISPGFADRLIVLAEKEQAHRHTSEDKLITAEIKDNNRELNAFGRGQIIAILSVIIICSLAVFCFYLATQFPEYAREFISAGKTIAITIIISLAGLFILKKTVLDKGKK